MSDYAIRAEGISKLYRLGAIEDRALSLPETVTRALTAPFRKRSYSREGSEGGEQLWALKDIGFEIKQGEVVGIIGRNGAGKSTLLKVLARITEPTAGEIRLRGRVASLLEVGTGFHPELSGRENIFLNGAILGMRRKEIQRKFDEIVQFAEVERFLDTPVKRYSSGMYTRLAFAVAAHLEPEILIVDEVLAVGDAAFQKKCLNKMQAVGDEGRTVLFVSHNMAAVTRLCPRAILLSQGKLLVDGPSHQIVSSYLQSGIGTMAAREWSDEEVAKAGNVRLRAVRVRNQDGKISEAVDIRYPVSIEIDFEVRGTPVQVFPSLHFFNEEGQCLFAVIDTSALTRDRVREPGMHRCVCQVPGNFFAEGTILLDAGLGTFEPFTVHAHERDVVAFQVIDSSVGDSARGSFAGAFPGMMRPLLPWTTGFEASLAGN